MQRTGAAPASLTAITGERGAIGLLTSGDVARLLAIDLKTVHSWVRGGHLTGLKTNGGHLRFHRGEVVRFLRRFGFDLPLRFDGAASRVALVGAQFADWPCPDRPAQSEDFGRPFDAVLALADGGFDTVALDLDELGLELATEFVGALRRGALTRSLVLIGVSQEPAARSAFTAGGGDVALAGLAELGRLTRFLGAD